ncbi:MAG: hypothetical protein JSR61_01140 [Proteobacteria bacterium]|nr:hypothetical protein [Pseudomonadota bacterium]
MPDPLPLEPDQAAAIAKVRRLMLIASVTTVVAIGAVFGAIGYKVFKAGDSPADGTATGTPGTVVEVTDTLPASAKVISTAVGDAQIVVTIDVGGATELRTYDPDTLKPLGRLRLNPQR